MHPTVARRSGAVRTSFVPTVVCTDSTECVVLRLRHPARSVRLLRGRSLYFCAPPGPWFPPPPDPAGGFALPMAEPAAPAAPVKEDKDYVAEVLRQLRSP